MVENFRPGVKERLGVDPDAVWAVNPRVVYASISGFGQDGPYASRPGVDQIAQGLGGLMSVTGPPGSGPWRVGIAISDTAAGTLLTQGVLAALIARDRTGRGPVGAHVAARGDGELHGLPGRALADRRRGTRPGGQPAPDDGADGRVPHRRRPPQRVGAARLPSRSANCSTRPSSPTIRATSTSRRATRTAPSSTPTSRACCRPARPRSGSSALADHVPCGPVLAVDEVFADPQVQHLQLTRRVSAPDARRHRRAAPAAHVQRHAGDGAVGSTGRRRAHRVPCWPSSATPTTRSTTCTRPVRSGHQEHA